MIITTRAIKRFAQDITGQLDDVFRSNEIEHDIPLYGTYDKLCKG